MGDKSISGKIIDALKKVEIQYKPIAEKFNMNAITANDLIDSIGFLVPNREPIGNGVSGMFYRVKFSVVEYLAPGFIEIEKDGGSREIVDLRPKQDVGEVVDV